MNERLDVEPQRQKHHLQGFQTEIHVGNGLEMKRERVRQNSTYSITLLKKKKSVNILFQSLKRSVTFWAAGCFFLMA